MDHPLDSRPRFVYKPLPKSQELTRFVEVLSCCDSIISCRIRNQRLRSSKHTCLSYRWGEEPATRSTRLNGSEFMIRQNLWDYLYRAYVDKIQEPLWIDAICIDQRNVEERNRQVQLMGRIYSTATRVIIWLGQASPDIAEMLSPMRLFCDQYNRHAYTFNTRHGSNEYYTERSQPLSKVDRDELKAFRGELSHAIGDHVALYGKTFNELCTNLYWTRMWIVQEIHVAHYALVMCGRGVIPWDRLTEFMALVRYSQDGEMRLFTAGWRGSSQPPGQALVDHYARVVSEQTPESCTTVDRILRHASYFAGDSDSRPPEMRSLLNRFGHLSCTDQRDRVYALLAIAPRFHGFTIDYAEDAVLFSFRVVEFCLSLDIGSSARQRREREFSPST